VARRMARPAGLLALCLVVALIGPAGAQEMPPWLEYSRPAEYDAIAERNHPVPTRDGSDLSCDLYRPGVGGVVAEGPFPGVVWQFHGYGTNRTARDSTVASGLAERGYVVLQCSVRGTGGSPGEWDPFTLREAEDGYDIVEWLAAQDYSAGRVGMVGYSYGAITAYLTAALAPPHLVTIVPQSAYADPYLDIVRLGGIRGLDVRVWLLGLIHALNASWTPPDQQAALVQRTQEIDEEWAAHPLHDEYWHSRAVDHDALERSGIPILGYGGWYDIYQRGMPANHVALPEQTWLVMEPNAHIGADYLGTLDRGVLAWLDHWVAQRPEAPLPGAKVTSYEMPLDGGAWTEHDRWPPAAAQMQRLHLTGDGVLARDAGEAGASTYEVDPEDGTPAYWNTGTRPDDPVLRAWHTQRESERLHFATAPLEEDVILAGTVTAYLRAAFSADDGHLVVRLSDVDPDGTATLISTGWLQASHRQGHTALIEVAPTEPASYEVEVWPAHWRIAAGHRLQLSVSSGDVPRIHPDAPDGTVAVLTGEGGSTVDVPLLHEPAIPTAPNPASGPGDAQGPKVEPPAAQGQEGAAGHGSAPLPATGGGLAQAALVLLLTAALVVTGRARRRGGRAART
jgi:uncharacterized protein